MLNTILELFAIGTAMSWIALAVIAILLTILTDTDWHFTKLFLITGAIVLLLPFIKTLGAANIIISILAYFVIGIIYSFTRWILRIKDIIQGNKQILKQYNISNINDIHDKQLEIRDKKIKIESIPYRDRDKNENSVIDNLSDDISILDSIEDNVDPKQNKDKLLNWVFYWPCSIIKLFTADLSEAIYNTCKNQYKNIVNYLLKNNLN